VEYTASEVTVDMYEIITEPLKFCKRLIYCIFVR